MGYISNFFYAMALIIIIFMCYLCFRKRKRSQGVIFTSMYPASMFLLPLNCLVIDYFSAVQAVPVTNQTVAVTHGTVYVAQQSRYPAQRPPIVATAYPVMAPAPNPPMQMPQP